MSAAARTRSMDSDVARLIWRGPPRQRLCQARRRRSPSQADLWSVVAAAATLALLLTFLLEAIVVALRLVLAARVLPPRRSANHLLARAVGVCRCCVDDDVLEVGEHDVVPRTAVDLVGLAVTRAEAVVAGSTVQGIAGPVGRQPVSARERPEP